MATWEAAGPWAMACPGRALDRRGPDGRLEVLDHPLRRQEEREDDREGKQEIEVDADDVDPEIPDRPGRMPGDPPHQSRGRRDAGRRRDKVMENEPDHLRKVGQCGFPRVILPVRVGGEAGRGVEGEVGPDGSEFLGIQREKMLEPEHGVREQQPGQAEDDEGPGVLPPVLLRLRVDAEDPVEEALDGLDRAVEPSPALGLEDPDEVETQGLRDHYEEAEEEGQLKPAVKVHRRHLVRTSRAAGHSAEDSRGAESRRSVPGCRSWSKPFAGPGVERAQAEE